MSANVRHCSVLLGTVEHCSAVLGAVRHWYERREDKRSHERNSKVKHF